MKSKIIYIRPKSNFATEFFELGMKKIHSCKVLKEESNRILVTPINQKCMFWIEGKNDVNWEVIK